MYLSPYGNVVDELLKRSLNSTYVNKLGSTFQTYELETFMGVGEDTQALIVTEIDDLSTQRWSQLEELLKLPRIKNFSVYLLGNSPSGEGFDLVKKRVIRQGLYVNAINPTGTLAQKHVGEWLGDEAHIHVQDAHKVCESLEWNLGLIMWTLKSYLSVSQGKVLSRSVSQSLLEQISFKDPITIAFEAVVSKSHRLDVSLDSEQTQFLIERLEQFLSNVGIVSGHMKDMLSDKKMSSLTGMPLSEISFLRSQCSRYPYKTIAKCSKQLKFAKDYITQPELAKTVAIIWAS